MMLFYSVQNIAVSREEFYMSENTSDNKKILGPSLLQTYISAAKVGAMTFGGGYAMLPIAQKEIVENRKMATEEDLVDFYALAQCLPGIIMVNTLAFIGYRHRGRAGAAAAALGAITPSIIIILIIASLLTMFSHVPAVQHAFAGIRVCVCVLIFNSIVKLWKKSIVDKICLIILLLVAAGSLLLDLSPILYVLGAAVAGIVITSMRAASASRGGEAK